MWQVMGELEGEDRRGKSYIGVGDKSVGGMLIIGKGVAAEGKESIRVEEWER